MDKNKKTQKRFKRNSNEEKRSLLKYEGGAEEAQPMEDMMMEQKMEEMKMEDKMEEEKKEEEEEKDDTHCCCKYSTAMLIYGIILWIFGIMILANAIIIFGNIYFPVVYPIVLTIIALIFFAGLVLIAIWFCNESEASRKCAIIGGWIILGAIIAMILWNVFYILNHNKHKKEGVKVGTGDDPDDYDEEDRSTYILGYLVWGLLILVLDVLFLANAINHADTFPPEDEEMMMMEEKMEEMMMEEKMEEMMMDPEMGPGEGAEGGQLERRKSSLRASSRSSSMRSMKSSKSARSTQKTPVCVVKNEAKLRNQRAAAFNEIDNNDTPRGSMKERFSYENGKTSQTIQFDNEDAQKKNKKKQNKSKKMK